MPSKRLSAYKWRKRKKECFHRDGYKCMEHGCEFRSRDGYGLEAHHIIFRSKGGSDDLDNLVTLCWVHHRKRHPEKQTRFTPNMKELREQGIKDFEKLYGQEKNDGEHKANT